MMNKEKKLCLIFLALLVVSCKAKYAPPAFTLCTYLESGKIYCVDNRLPEMKDGKEMEIRPSDIVMPPESFKSFYKWGADIRQKLIECESRSSY